jgi:Baculovirus DNA helicase
MAAAVISTNEIFDNIYSSNCEDRTNIDNVILNNSVINKKKIINSYDNFIFLIKLLHNSETNTAESIDCVKVHDMTIIKAHDWCVQQNVARMFVCPFVSAQYYNDVQKDIDFTEFIHCNYSNYANLCLRSGDYYYWPNIAVLFSGWSLFLYKNYGINMNLEIPLVHHKNLGNVNLFRFNPEDFLNVELNFHTDDKTLFVNGRSTFTEEDDDLFLVTLTNGQVAKCQMKPNLVYSNKNFFDYLKDDITLTSCSVTESFKHLIDVNLDSWRVFEEKSMPSVVVTTKDKLKVFSNITPSSENLEPIQVHIIECIAFIKEKMIETLSKHEIANEKILENYFVDSDFLNFDFIIFALWKMIIKSEVLTLTKTDIKLFLELICEIVFECDTNGRRQARSRCEPYCKLTPKVFMRLCNHWYVFINENPCESLAYYYGIHYMIYITHNTWDYTLDNAKTCGVAPKILCNGFLKKIITSGNMIFVFNGQHYTLVKKDEELFKLTEESSGIIIPNIKFNNWKYLYFTEEGVYNLFINNFHSSCPFIIGNTLLKSFTRKNETTYLPERVIHYMLDSGKKEMDIYRIYHMAKMCRQIETVKKNMTAILAFNICEQCKIMEQNVLNDLFRDVWMYDYNELIIMAIYLNSKKMNDLIINFKCEFCARSSNKKCACLSKMDIDSKAFRVVIVMELFLNNQALLELAWSLLYSTSTYSQTLKICIDQKAGYGNFIEQYADYFFLNRKKIIKVLYNKLEKIDYIENFIIELADAEKFLEILKKDCYNEDDDDNHNEVDDEDGTVLTKHNIENFHWYYYNTINTLQKFNVWWDKLILSRHNEDLNSWLTRFYMRIIMTKLDLHEYSFTFVKQIVMGYLYFRQFTNFNYINTLTVIHFGASTGIPTDYEKCCLYLNGKPGSGKSSFFSVFDHCVVVHKHDSAKYTLTKKDTNEMEADKMISQLYVINEMKVCDDSFFKSTADSTKSNSVCRKYEGSQKYEGNFKLLIVNNKPLHISDYDKGVRNRFAIIYTDHLFEEGLTFNGSIYWHIKNKLYPMEKTYIEELAKPVRLFLSHILLYKKNAKDGYVSYKVFIEKDPIHRHNLMCLDINNSHLNALLYVLKVKVKPGNKLVDESKIEKMIELAVPYVETMLHDLLISKRTSSAHKVAMLMDAFRRKFKKYYIEHEKLYYNIDMALEKSEFNMNKPEFKC